MKTALSFSIRLTLVFFSFQLAGQSTFSKVYQDSNTSNSLSSGIVLSTADNGFLIAGNNNLVRFDSLGNVKWSKILGANDFIGTIIQNLDTTYYFLTNEKYTGNSNPTLTRMNAHGGLLWSRKVQYGSYQNCIPLSASATVDSGVVICGYGYPNLESINTFVSRFDKLGNLVWRKTISAGDTSTIYRSIKQTPDSGFILLGTLNQRTASMIKLTKTGTVSWCKYYTSKDSTETFGVDVIVKNNKIYSYFISGKPVFVVCDLAGNFLNAREFEIPYYYDPINQHKGCMLSPTNKNGVLMTLDSYANEIVIKMDSLSNIEWSTSSFLYGSLTATQLSDKGYIIAGGGPFAGFKPSDIPHQMGVIKLDSSGKGLGCAYENTVSSSSTTLNVASTNYTLVQLGSVQTSSLSVNSTTISQRNGCINYVNPGIHEYNNKEDVSVYPNPSSGVIYIQLKDNYYSVLKYSIVNLNGEIVKEEFAFKNESVHKMDCSSIAPGAYVLKVSDKQNVIASRHLIITP